MSETEVIRKALNCATALGDTHDICQSTRALTKRLSTCVSRRTSVSAVFGVYIRVRRFIHPRLLKLPIAANRTSFFDIGCKGKF